MARHFLAEGDSCAFIGALVLNLHDRFIGVEAAGDDRFHDDVSGHREEKQPYRETTARKVSGESKHENQVPASTFL